jgi:hypothetical protein
MLPEYVTMLAATDTSVTKNNPGNTDPGMPPPGSDDDATELETLSSYARFDRGDALGEIMAQKDEFLSEFMSLLVATPVSHPQTLRLVHYLNLVAAYTAMYWKSHYARLRPSHVMPRLRPPAQVPGHASYPSGHAAQSGLIAAVLGTDIVPTRNTDLNGLAARIALNRELGGFHYPSDTKAGMRLASRIRTQLNTLSGTSAYKTLLGKAKDEWKDLWP